MLRMTPSCTIEHRTDIAIVGAGIVGLALAWKLKRRYPDLSVTIFEKEPELACHASGRNSGVLHSGIYYPKGSLKAAVCANGARQLTEYCVEHHLPFKRVGKVILPLKEADNGLLDMLYQRARYNGACVELIDEAQLKTIEPEAYSMTGKALYSPDTAVFDPVAIVQALAEHLRQVGVCLRLKSPITGIDPEKSRLTSNRETVTYGYLFNTAGLHADRVAKTFGIGDRYQILPFKGLYYQLSPKSMLTFNGHIYPVPDLRVPFLGVHSTVSCHDQVYFGPTAIPALGREHYNALKGIEVAELPEILYRILEQYLMDQNGFRYFTHQEAFRFLKPNFVRAVQALIPRLQPHDVIPSSKVGIRAQLLDKQTGRLEQDFVIEDGERSTHILNAVSPAFTSAFAFADLILERCPDFSRQVAV